MVVGDGLEYWVGPAVSVLCYLALHRAFTLPCITVIAGDRLRGPHCHRLYTSPRWVGVDKFYELAHLPLLSNMTEYTRPWPEEPGREDKEPLSPPCPAALLVLLQDVVLEY